MDDLHARRTAAAATTLGISNDAIHEAVLRAIPRLPAPGDLLDFGAGSGGLLRRVDGSQPFRSLCGVDIMPRPAGLPEYIAWTAGDLNEPAPYPGESFDIIVSSEVIEHLENPRATLREWARLLRRGGFAVFSTPNNESVRSLLRLCFLGHFAAFGDLSYPAHITALLRKDIERACAEAGFEMRGFTFSHLGGLPFSRRITWQNLSFGLLGGLRFSDNIVAAARKR